MQAGRAAPDSGLDLAETTDKRTLERDEMRFANRPRTKYRDFNIHFHWRLP